VAPNTLNVKEGVVTAVDGRRLEYRELVAGQALHVRASAQSVRAKTRNVIGKPVPRVDIPGKVTGGVAYVQDLRLPGMVHARVVRPPQHGAKLVSLDTARAERMPGVLRVVHDGSYVAVIATREFEAVRAARALSDRAKWDGGKLPPRRHLSAPRLARLPGHRHPRPAVVGPRARDIGSRVPPSLPLHGAIGPSCAVGLFQDGKLTIWSHTQGVYPLRGAIAEMVGMERENVRCIHMEGSGCYGHNGADDAGADAALLARALPGRPVRVQWMREEEHSWEPFGPRDGDARPCLARRRANLGLGIRLSGAIRIRRGRARQGSWVPRACSRNRSRLPRRGRSRSPRAAAIETRFLFMRFLTPRSRIGSFPRCRCASRRCARSAHT
jgi:hypothetical protein